MRLRSSSSQTGASTLSSQASSSQNNNKSMLEKYGPPLVTALMVLTCGVIIHDRQAISQVVRQMSSSLGSRGEYTKYAEAPRVGGGMGNVSKEQHDQHKERLQATPTNPPLLHQIAPSIFPVDPENHSKIQFPEKVQHVMIDVGARESDYLNTLERLKDPSIALIMVDPLPESNLPLQSRAAVYNQQGLAGKGQYPHPDFGDRVFLIKGAMGEEESITNFNVGAQPACGSLLKTSSNNTFFCWKTKKQLPVNVFTLQSLLDMLPETIQTIHLKTDTEGADHLVLKGAGDALRRVDTIIIECMPPPSDAEGRVKPRRDGQCNDLEVVEWMCKDQDFCDSKIIPQGGLSNILFWKQSQLSPDRIPSYLTQPTISFHDLYTNLMATLRAEKKERRGLAVKRRRANQLDKQKKLRGKANHQ